jgi:hypothetical protein
MIEGSAQAIRARLDPLDDLLAQEEATEERPDEREVSPGRLQRVRMMERAGIEPATSGLQSRRSPS